MAFPDRFCHGVGRSLKLACIPGLDLAAQRRALAIGDGDIFRRGGVAHRRLGFDRDVLETRAFEIGLDGGLVVIAMRRPCHEKRWIVGKHFAERRGRVIREHIVRDAVPHVEQVSAARLQHAPGFRVALAAIRKEHRAELAADDVEFAVVERQHQRIGLAPGHAGIVTLTLLRDREHGLVEIGCDIADA